MTKKSIVVKEEKDEVINKKEVKKETEVNFKTSGNSILISVIMIIIGAILFFIPDGINSIIGYVIGGSFLLAGLLTVLKYFKPNVKASIINLVSGILYFAVGIIIILNSNNYIWYIYVN